MRSKRQKKRKIDPDPRYQSVAMAKFINYIMRKGKKNTAQKIAYGALEKTAQEQQKDPVDILENLMQILGPSVEVRSRRIGGANYQIPVPVRPERRSFLAMRWLLDAARKKKGKTMEKKLFEEINSVLKGEGDAMKKKQDVHRMAEANRAFAHFA